MNSRFNSKIRIEEIEEAIRNVQKDGLKVGITEDGKLYVENTTHTKSFGYDDDFGYAETKCFSD